MLDNSLKYKRSERGECFRGSMHRRLTQDEQSSQIHQLRPRDDNLCSSDDSTQPPPNMAFEIEFPDQMDSICRKKFLFNII